MSQIVACFIILDMIKKTILIALLLTGILFGGFFVYVNTESCKVNLSRYLIQKMEEPWPHPIQLKVTDFKFYPNIVLKLESISLLVTKDQKALEIGSALFSLPFDVIWNRSTIIPTLTLSEVNIDPVLMQQGLKKNDQNSKSFKLKETILVKPMINIQNLNSKVHSNLGEAEIKGSITLSPTIQLSPRGYIVESNLDLKEINISYEGGAIQKSSGDALTITSKVANQDEKQTIDSMIEAVIKAQDPKLGAIAGSGKAELHLSDKNMSAVFGIVLQDIKVNGELNSDGEHLKGKLNLPRTELGSIVGLLPKLAPYRTSGLVEASVEISGAKSQPNIGGHILANKVQFSAPGSDLRPEMDAEIQFSGDKISNANFKLMAPGSQLIVRASVDSFSSPHILATVQSPGLDIDRILGHQSSTAHHPQNQSHASGAMPDFLKALQAEVNLDLKAVQVFGQKFPELKGKAHLSYDRFQFNIENVSYQNLQQEISLAMDHAQIQILPLTSEVELQCTMRASGKGLWTAEGPLAAKIQKKGQSIPFLILGDEIAMNFPSVDIQKKKGDPFRVKGIILENAEHLSGEGEISFWDAVLMWKVNKSPDFLKFHADLKDWSLKTLSVHVKQLQSYTLSGNLNLKVDVENQGQKKKEEAHITLSQLTASQISQPSKLEVHLHSLSPLRGDIAFEAPAIEIRTDNKSKIPSPANYDLDLALTKRMNSPFLRAAQMQFHWMVHRFAYDVFALKEFTGVTQWTYPALKMNIQNIDLLDGKIKMNSETRFDGKVPQYSGSFSMSNIHLDEAFLNQIPKYKKTLTGLANFETNFAGRSLKPAVAVPQFASVGKFHATNASLSFADIGQSVTQGINDGIGKAAQFVPSLKDKKVSFDQKHLDYETFDADVQTRGKVFAIKNIQGKAVAQKGFDLGGFLNGDVERNTVDGTLEVSDTYNLTKAADVSVNAGSIQIPRVLMDGDQSLSFPVKMGCQISSPCVDKSSLSSKVADNAKKNSFRVGKAKVVDEVKSKAGEGIGQLRKAFGF